MQDIKEKLANWVFEQACEICREGDHTHLSCLRHLQTSNILQNQAFYSSETFDFVYAHVKHKMVNGPFEWCLVFDILSEEARDEPTIDFDSAEGFQFHKEFEKDWR